MCGIVITWGCCCCSGVWTDGELSFIMFCCCCWSSLWVTCMSSVGYLYICWKGNVGGPENRDRYSFKLLMSCWALLSWWCCCWNLSFSSASVSTFTNTSFWPVLLNNVLSIWFWIWRVLDVGTWTCPLRLWWFSCDGSTVLTAICRPWDDGIETNPWSWACWNFPTAKCGIVANVVGKPPNGVKLIVKQWALYTTLTIAKQCYASVLNGQQDTIYNLESTTQISQVYSSAWHTICGNCDD